MKIWTWAAATAAAIVLGAGLAVAQPPAGGRMRMSPRYDKAHETTVKGTVEDVTEQAASHMGGQMGGMGGGMMAGTHLTLKTDKETMVVLVGPSNWLKQQNVSFTKGETLEVTGAPTTYAGKPALIAREITANGKTLTLRNADGVPVWAHPQQ